ncbi:hypothetical protein SAMN05443287_104202 [Micromonospora phaseoli]|uniref:Integral membrane protein n=1 Tax=Micromonospora phaseoli TaxID=1144548 RepID=A0A1H6YF41_9ACTN|nr:hypothetical protein [Micromonospora phaseoli]PZW00174.1 hypothetical protein CLV64_103201 [Micromonospora phaseoli]GIJ78880.1 hypothetical protein Xph01_33120 [Micromonospora phaseoli]SEJ39908.1 hypothetical protein SAMN05443287_104202 [Micromonospora phaseoli]
MTSGPGTSDDVVELRVHGVSGAGAEQILDRPHSHQVAGDRNGGFYRPRPGYPDTQGPSGVTMEAYRWSDLPSGTISRTLSLVFLLPFMLCNVAIWMRPPYRGTAGAGLKAVCRLLALTLTMLYVLAAMGVSLDLIAWRCLPNPHCLAGRPYLSWLGDRPTGLTLAVFALLPAAALGLLWRLAARPAHNFAAFRTPTTTSGAHQLSAVGQWDGAPTVSRLCALHVAAGFATLSLGLLIARIVSGPSTVSVALAAFAALVLIACTALLCAHPLIDTPAPHPLVDRLAGGLRSTAVALTPLVLAAVTLDPTPWRVRDGLPGYAMLVGLIILVQAVLLVVLGTVALASRSRRRTGTGTGSLRGLGAPVIAAAATGLAVAISADLVYKVADLLNRRAAADSESEIGPPLGYKWAIFVFLVAAACTLAAAVVVTLATRPGRIRIARAIVARDHPDAPPQAQYRLRQVERMIARARLTERVEVVAVVYGCVVGAGMPTSLLGMLRLAPPTVVERLTGIPAAATVFGLQVGSLLISAVVLALLVGGIFAYRTAAFRRHVGILWDLGTFWPRAAHPFAPPCYAERAVPELSRRIVHLTEQGHGVLLTGHSHGSVLLAATVLQLPPEVCGRLALLTYGSPLRRLYARLFPAFIDEKVLREVGERVNWRWLNLWRDTDPIGGWVFSPHRAGRRPATPDPALTVDRRLRDPWDVVPPPGDSVPPEIVGHWPGESDPRFEAAVADLAGRLRDRPPEPGGPG